MLKTKQCGIIPDKTDFISLSFENSLAMSSFQHNIITSKRFFLPLILTLVLSAVIAFIYQRFYKYKIHRRQAIEECDHRQNAVIPVLPSNILRDKNDVQLLHARLTGLKKPFESDSAFDSQIRNYLIKNELIELKDNRLYHIKPLNHSHPYLIPEAVDMVNEIAFRFQKKLDEQKLGHYCFFLTSLLRTAQTQKKLSRRNRNATENSTHLYGTTVDISYKDFYNLDNDSTEAKWEVVQALTQTLVEMRQECKILAVKERKQSCFHMTTVVCSPAKQN